MKSTLMRRLSILLVLAMVLAILPVGALAADYPDTLYLKPNANWVKDGARFAAYFFNGSGNTWVSMTDADGDGVYEVAVPTSATWTHVIFCRMNPANEVNQWGSDGSNKWNQTADLAMPTDGTNLYTVAEDTWDKGGGVWSTYTPGDVVTEVTAAPKNYSYYVAGDFTGWSECNDDYGMTDTDGDGIYTATFAITAGTHKLKITNGTWNDAVGGTGDNADGDGNYVFECAQDGDLTVSFNSNDKTFELSGSCLGEAPELVIESAKVKGTITGLDWDETSDVGTMTLVDGIYTLTIDGVAASAVGDKAYEFKVVVNNDWTTSYPSSNWTFYMKAEGSVTITFDPAAEAGNEVTLTGENVTYEAPSEGGDVTETTYYVGGSMNSWAAADEAYAMTAVGDGTYTYTFTALAAGSYSLKVTDGTWTNSWTAAEGSEYLAADGNLSFTVTADCDVIVTFDGSAVTVSGTNVTAKAPELLVVDKVVVAGGAAGDGEQGDFLYGENWVHDSSLNGLFADEGSMVYSNLYYNVPAGSYEFKFFLNGSTSINFASGLEIESGVECDAWFNAMGNSTLTIAEDGATVEFVLDLTNVTYVGDNAKMKVTVTYPETSKAPNPVVVGTNDYVILSGDRNPVVGTYTAAFTGKLTIYPSAMATEDWMTGEMVDVPAEYIGNQFGMQYAILVDGEQKLLPITIDVVEGQTYEIGVQSGMGAPAEITLTLCDNHAPTYAFDSANGIHSASCAACGQSASVQGVAGDSGKLTGLTLALYADISVLYMFNLPEGLSNPYVLFTVGDMTEKVTPEAYDETYGYTYRYKGINPMLMGDDITATLYASVGGMEVALYSFGNFSVRDYCVQMLNTDDAKLKTMISDILVYGAQAQIYSNYKTTELVTTGLTLTPSTFPGVDKLTSKFSQSGEANSVSDLYSLGAAMSNQVYMFFTVKITDDVNQYSAVITMGDKTTTIYGYEFEDKGNNLYNVNYKDFAATQFDEEITIVLYKNVDGEDVAVGRSFTYTINSHIKAIGGGTDAMALLLQTVYNYGESAKAYAG